MQKHRRLRIADPERDALRRTLEDLVPVRIVRLAEVIARLATQSIESTVGLRNTDLRLLNLLDGTEGVTVNEIARRAHVDKAWSAARCATSRSPGSSSVAAAVRIRAPAK